MPNQHDITKRLNNLLTFFPDSTQENDPMRVLTEPEKFKAIPDTNKTSAHIASIEKSFGSDARSALTRLPIVPTTTFMPHSSPIESAPITPTAMVRIGDTGSTTYDSKTRTWAEGAAGRRSSGTRSNINNSNETIKFSGGKYKSHERHHFAKINASSFVSCSSPTGIYSEIAIVLWVDNKHYTKYNCNDRYRIVVSAMYDGEDDLWAVAAKLIKRTSYLAKDEDETQISNRLCTASELCSEIKKMLLYMGVSPRDAYRKFRRNMEEEMTVVHSDYGFTTVECMSHTRLMKELNKISPYTTQSAYGIDWHNRHHRSSFTHHGGVHNRQDTDALRSDMMDYCGGE